MGHWLVELRFEFILELILEVGAGVILSDLGNGLLNRGDRTLVCSNRSFLRQTRTPFWL